MISFYVNTRERERERERGETLSEEFFTCKFQEHKTNYYIIYLSPSPKSW